MDLLERRSALEHQRLAELDMARDAKEHVALGVVALDDELAHTAVLRRLLDASLEQLHVGFLGEVMFSINPQRRFRSPWGGRAGSSGRVPCIGTARRGSKISGAAPTCSSA